MSIVTRSAKPKEHVYSTMEEGFEKVKISDEMETEMQQSTVTTTTNSETLDLLGRFLGVQQRRAEVYARLRRGFTEYMVGGGDLAYQRLCSEITHEFNDCSKQVMEIESLFLNPNISRNDLASLLRSVQTHEKQKLHLTVTIQVLKKAGRPSERLVSHDKCKFSSKHECAAHVEEITVDVGTEEAEEDAEYEAAMKEAIRGVQDAVTSINDHLDEVRYEMDALREEAH